MGKVNIADDVKKYVEKHKITYPIVIGSRTLLDMFEVAIGEKIDTIPSTIIIGKGGVILKKLAGAQEKDVLQREYKSATTAP